MLKHNWQHFHKNKILSNLLLKRDLVIRLIRVCRLQARAKMSDKFDSHAIQTCVDDLSDDPFDGRRGLSWIRAEVLVPTRFNFNLIGWTWPLQIPSIPVLHGDWILYSETELANSILLW